MTKETPSLDLIRPFSRRNFMRECACGFAYLAFLGLEADAGTAYLSPLASKSPHFPARAKRIIFLYMHGGVSHVDTFDPKPELVQFDGEPTPGGNPATASPTGALLKSPWNFRKC